MGLVGGQSGLHVRIRFQLARTQHAGAIAQAFSSQSTKWSQSLSFMSVQEAGKLPFSGPLTLHVQP